jgi:hypothetical protein
LCQRVSLEKSLRRDKEKELVGATGERGEQTADGGNPEQADCAEGKGGASLHGTSVTIIGLKDLVQKKLRAESADDIIQGGARSR